jgi:CRP/FNR family cyclic AMP-dependent transcriptional regulator
MTNPAVFDCENFLAMTGNGHIVTKYHSREAVFAQGDPADALFYLKSGKIKVTVVSHQGKVAVVAILGEGDFLGEGCLNAQSYRMTSATALEESTIARIERAVILRTLHIEPSFAEMFVTHLLGRNLRMEADLVDQLFNSSEKRLARLLLILANFGKDEKPETVIPKISQETLAEMVGTTRSRISFFMNKFRRLGLIEYNGHLTVNSSLLNLILHDD